MDIQGLQAQVEDLMQEFDRLRSGAEELQRKIAEVEVTEVSPDGYVSATVGPRGQLIRLELDPRIYRNPDSTGLADTITETVQAAAAGAVERVTELCSPLIAEEEVTAHLTGDIDGIMRRLDHQLPRGE